MNVKVVITLILGLVFQLAQVLPGAVVATSCPAHAESCGCCKTGKSCECATNGNSDQKPPPAPIDNSASLKVMAAGTAEDRFATEDRSATDPIAAIRSFKHTGPLAGFRGVHISVAFCTFVI